MIVQSSRQHILLPAWKIIVLHDKIGRLWYLKIISDLLPIEKLYRYLAICKPSKSNVTNIQSTIVTNNQDVKACS